MVGQHLRIADADASFPAFFFADAAMSGLRADRRTGLAFIMIASDCPLPVSEGGLEVVDVLPAV